MLRFSRNRQKSLVLFIAVALAFNLVQQQNKKLVKTSLKKESSKKLLQYDDPLNTLGNTKSNPDSAQEFSFLNPMAGGVLPIRRFTIRGGHMFKLLNGGATSAKTVTAAAAAADDDQRNILLTVENCNGLCLESDRCDAWEFRNLTTSTRAQNETCMLFTNNETSPLEIHQAIDNNPNFVVGFAQKRAGVLKPAVQSKEDEVHVPKEKKVLYILHFHHEIIPHAYARILNEIFPSSWMTSFMDLVVITPREVSLLVAKGVNAEEIGLQGSSSLVNPFSPYDDSSRKGSNGQMSLPIARAKFAGYGGYLLVNDDAMVKFWELPSDLWFGDRPWGTFAPLQYSQQTWGERMIKKRYPYGNYKWSWYNYDSGSVALKTGAVRSNFDAALDAMKDLCRNETGITNDMDDVSVAEFCGGQSEQNVLNPYVHGGGKADILYVPGNKLGASMSRAITLFGEHDVFMEIAYPMIMNVVVPRERVLEMPICDNSIQSWRNKYDSNIVQFKPYFKKTREEGGGLQCPVIHPIKFGLEVSIAYWKDVITNSTASHCSWCTWKDTDNNAGFWTLAN